MTAEQISEARREAASLETQAVNTARECWSDARKMMDRAAMLRTRALLAERRLGQRA